MLTIQRPYVMRSLAWKYSYLRRIGVSDHFRSVCLCLNCTSRREVHTQISTQIGWCVAIIHLEYLGLCASSTNEIFLGHVVVKLASARTSRG